MTDIFFEYLEKFGHHVSWAFYSDEQKTVVLIEMEKALKGERGPLTDAEFGMELSEDAKS